MTSKEIISQIKDLENLQTKSTLLKHGAKEPFYGVRVEDLKKIARKVKGNQALALELFDSKVTDAMYLAGFICDGKKMTKENLEQWVKLSNWYFISETSVAWAAAESNYGFELAMKWIDSKDELVAVSGWATLAALATIKQDKDLDLNAYEKLVARVLKEMNQSPNRVRYNMNHFLITVGGAIASLTDETVSVGNKIGKITVNIGGVSTKVPFVKEQIEKLVKKGAIGTKKKSAKS